MTKENLKEIELEIQKLQNSKKAILEHNIEEKIKEIKSLKCTTECLAILEICSFSSVGLPKYKITLAGYDFPVLVYTNRIITLAGDSSFYENNLTFKTKSFLEDYATIVTNNESLLCDFLSQVEFKEIKFNEKSLKVLQAAEACQKRIQKT